MQEAALTAASRSSAVFELVAAADSADRTVVALNCHRSASAAVISAIIPISAISRSVIVRIVMALRTHSHSSERSVYSKLS
jgi:hypothetical protein